MVRALVIDDSKPMREALKRMLVELRVSVTTAKNGRDAIGIMARSAPFDVAIVDWQMPVMNGMEWLHSIKADEQFNSIKVVMVTSNHDIMAAIENGVDRYISKPFSKRMIRNSLVRLGFELPDIEY